MHMDRCSRKHSRVHHCSVLVLNAFRRGDERSSANPFDSMESQPKLAEWQRLLDDMTQWLRLSLQMQVATSTLLCREEQSVGSSTEDKEWRTASFSQYGGACIENFLEKLARVDPSRMRSFIAPPGTRKLADALARFMTADTGFGPLGAYLLHLQTLFSWQPHLEVDAARVAGMFEMIVAALHSHGLEGLVNAVSNWAMLIIFVITVLQRREVMQPAEEYMGAWVKVFLQNMMHMDSEHERDGWWERITQLQGWELFSRWRFHLGSADIDADFYDYSNMWENAACSLGDADMERLIRVVLQDVMEKTWATTHGAGPVEYHAGSALELKHPDNPHVYRVIHVCYICPERRESMWGTCSAPYDEAKKEGWSRCGKLGRTWRCPKCSSKCLAAPPS